MKNQIDRLSDEEIQTLIDQRLDFKKNRQFDKSDKIRDRLLKSLVSLRDEKGTTVWWRLPEPEEPTFHFTEAFNRDYEFYLKNKDIFTFSGQEYIPVQYEEWGLNAKEAFWKYETVGWIEPCSEPLLFQEIVNCKKSINLHIKMWAEGYDDVMIPPEELIENAPDWVYKSIRNQRDLLMKKSSARF